MTKPTSDPRRDADPTMAADHDLERAWRDANALAGDERGPAPAVRANVLTIARAAALDAATSAASVPKPTPPALELTLPGIGRALAANLSSWRARVGAAACIALMALGVAWRYDDRPMRPDGETEVAAVERLPSRDPRLPQPAVPGLTVPPEPAAAPADVMPAPVPEPLAASAPAAKPAARPEAKFAAAATPGRDDGRVVVAAAVAPKRVPPTLGFAAAPRATPVAPAPAAPPPMVVALAPPAPAPAPAAPVAATTAAAPSVKLAGADGDAASGSSSISSRVASAKVPGSLAALASPPAEAAQAARADAALLRAADADDVPALARLLATGAPVDGVDAQGRTALLHAVLAHQAAAVRALLAAGADPGRADAGGLTPRAAARQGGDAAIAALFAAR